MVAGPKLSLRASDFIGDMLLFGTSAAIAAFIIFSKKMDLSLGSSFALIIVLAIYLAPVGVLGGLESTSLARVPAAGWAAILWMAIPCTGLTLALYLRGLRFITVSESAILLLIQILTGLVLAYVLLGEGLTFYGILGACLLSLAVLLSSLKLGKSATVKTRTTAHESA